jgi:hypothetical protein
VERGKLEAQTILLCRSIRQFGGVYRDAPIYAFQPRRGREAGKSTLAALRALGVVISAVPLNADVSEKGTLNKIFVSSHAEGVLDEPRLVFMDSDTVVIAEPADLDLPPGVDVAVRPADSTRLNSVGPGDPMEAYWRRVFHDHPMDEVPFVSTELGRRVRAYFSAGLIAVRREAGLFREWEDRFRYLVSRGIVLEGALGRMDEVALIATVVPRFDRARLLDHRYNYLIFKRPTMIPLLRGLPLHELVHLHYRSAFYAPGFLKSVRPPFDPECPIFQWLERHLPLDRTIMEPVARPQDLVYGAETHAH